MNEDNNALIYLTDRIDQLEEENAKLRELVRTAWSCVNRPLSCYECGVAHGGCTLKSTMHELEVEVDE